MTWFQSLKNLWTYYGYYRKVIRIQSDFEAFVEEWNRIGGFDASTKQLYDLLDKSSLVIVEYATWTPIQWDDTIAKMIRNVLIDHRDIVINLINWARKGYEPSETEMQAIAGRAYSDVHGSPMMILYILSTIYQVLQYLKLLQPDGVIPPPDNDPAPAPKRPIINFIRKVFNKHERRQTN